MLKKPVALLVDIDDDNLNKMAARLRPHQFEILQLRSVLDANSQLDGLTPDLAVIALDLPDGDGLSLLGHPGLDQSAIILTNNDDDPDRVRQGMLAGASYFFCHPADEVFLSDLFDDLAAEIRKASQNSIKVSHSVSPIEQFGLLRGSSPAMHKLYRTLRKVAPSNASVFLIGENGTGRELVAQTIHQLSDRSTGPFVAVNCGAIPENTIEGELFGYQDESSGQRRIGYFERAYGGTLFLDEITGMSSEMQVKLLRTLETNQLHRGAGDTDIPTDVRIVAASNRDPEETVQPRPLREDLYFRIASFPLHIPPLRARGEDIRGLADFFLQQFNEQSGKEKTLSRDAAAVLEAYSWPGNVRELRRVMEQAHIMAEQDITPEHLPDLNGQPASSGDVLQLNIGDSVQDAEKKLTLATLTFYNGDKRKAAQTLGVSLKTLYNRINAYQSDKRAPSDSNAAASAAK